MPEIERGGVRDLRTPALGLVAWLSALATLRVSPAAVPLLAGALVVVLCWLRRPARTLTPSGHATALACGGLVALAVWGSVVLHTERVRSGVTHDLAAQEATVQVHMEVDSDPVLKQGKYGSFVIFRGRVIQIEGRGETRRVSAPLLVLADPPWRALRLGCLVLARGRLSPADDPDLSAVLGVRGAPRILSGEPLLFRVAERVRTGIHEAVSGAAPVPRALVPALVDGDDAGLDVRTEEDFRATGLTHLLAVSGTNLTLVVGFALIVARGVGVRARGLLVVGALGVAGFVLLARPEPSVLRAAAMGSVALIGMGSNGRERGSRALGLAVLMLVLVNPWLAVSVGFALSALATAGILYLAPGWRDRMMTWMPRPIAEAIAVPAAAQLACTPLVAAISGQVSLVAVAANLLAGPLVGPATVLGLLGGIASSVAAPLGHLPGMLAGWCTGWIVAVARHCANLPTAAIGWPTTTSGLVAITLVCVLVGALLGPVLARRRAALLLLALGSLLVLVPLPAPGWPPRGWVMVACNIGQGDGLVLNAGGGSGVVVDAGPDPALMDRCLRRLRIGEVPRVVLTHFHADHIEGFEGVLTGRKVGAVEVTTLAEPLSGVREVRAVAGEHHVPVEVTQLGETVRAGPLTWRTVAPPPRIPPETGSPPNDSSIVMYVVARGVRLLLMGDEEGPSQEDLAQMLPGLRVDVLKVAHHGSAKQDPALVRATGARLAVISCGVDNDYGHPAPSTLALLRSAGMQVARTDLDGDVAVVVDDRGRLRVASRMPLNPPRPGA